MQVKDEAELFDYMFTSLEDTPDVSTECNVCLSGHLWVCGYSIAMAAVLDSQMREPGLKSHPQL